jgi:competence protein ComEC
VIDRFALWREGAHALWFAPDGIRVQSVRRNPGARPWSPQRRKAR